MSDDRYVVREGPGGTRLAGHSLWREGRPYDSATGHGTGPARCSCGAESEFLTSNYQRKKWHAAHKAAVANGGAA